MTIKHYHINLIERLIAPVKLHFTEAETIDLVAGLLRHIEDGGRGNMTYNMCLFGLNNIMSQNAYLPGCWINKHMFTRHLGD